MTCIVCGKTLADIEQFPLSPAARKMLEKQLGINRKAVSASSRACYECSIQGETKAD
jgi:hypothetical protein